VNLSRLPDARAAEQVATLLTRPGLRVERIVSRGQASPPGFWYDQAEGEWVLVLRTVVSETTLADRRGVPAGRLLERQSDLGIPRRC
jgi:cupin 2 domain-containing protein